MSISEKNEHLTSEPCCLYLPSKEGATVGSSPNISRYHRSMVSCQKGPNRHAYAWQIGPFWQDTLEIRHEEKATWGRSLHTWPCQTTWIWCYHFMKLFIAAREYQYSNDRTGALINPIFSYADSWFWYKKLLAWNPNTDTPCYNMV